MISNYHTHTIRCKHAKGTEREYIEAAIAAGIEILGFSDHTPLPFPSGYSSNIRMSFTELADYVQTLKELREEFKNDIKIFIGLEVEYLPQYFSNLCDILYKYKLDYMILGQHYLDHEINGIKAISPTIDDNVLVRYIDLVIEAILTNKFMYIAHPEIINYQWNNNELYASEVERLCRTAKRENIPLELNIPGLSSKSHNRQNEFWQIAGNVGNNVILGWDAHNPNIFSDKKSKENALIFAEKFSLQLIPFIDYVK